MYNNICFFFFFLFKGCAGILFGYPFDTVKVHIQTQKPNQRLYNGTLHCFKTIIARESAAGLYRGITSPMAGVALVNAIVFGVYGNIQRNSADPDSIKTHFLAGTTAGLVQTVITSPMELAKTRMQLQSQQAKGALVFRGPLECVRYIQRTEGIRGIYRGFGITAIRDVPGFASYFVLYELMIRTSPDPGAFHTLMAGGFAGVLSWIFSCPIDVVKTRLQADGGSKSQYNGIQDCIRKSYQAEGLSFLTRGMSSTLMRAFIMNSVCFYVVSYTMKTFGDTRIEVVVPKLEPIRIEQIKLGTPDTFPIALTQIAKKQTDHRSTELSHSFNYMSALSDAVCNNEIIELENDLHDDRKSNNDIYYNLNIDGLKDYQSVTADTGGGVKTTTNFLLSD